MLAASAQARHLAGSVVLLVMIWALGPDFSAAGADRSSPTTQESIRGWIEQLGSDSYQRRRAAQKRLIGAGLAAFRQLNRALASGDPEVRARVESVLRAIRENARPRLLWQYRHRWSPDFPPAVAGGKGYVGIGGDLVVIDLRTGKGRKIADWYDVAGTPLLLDGVLYGLPRCRPCAMDPLSGKKHWEFGVHCMSFSRGIAAGRMFFGGFDGNVYGLSAKTGKLAWKFTSQSIIGAPAVGDGAVFFSCLDNHLYALDAATGRQRWRYPTKHVPCMEPRVHGRAVHFATCFKEKTDPAWNRAASGRVYLHAVDARTGRRRWMLKLELPFIDASHSGFQGNPPLIPVMDPPAADEKALYFPACGRVHAVDLATGKLLWTVRPNVPKDKWHGPMISPVAVHDGAIYFGATDGLYAMDLETRTILWKHPTRQPVWVRPLVRDGIVYISTAWMTHGRSAFYLTGHGRRGGSVVLVMKSGDTSPSRGPGPALEALRLPARPSK